MNENYQAMTEGVLHFLQELGVPQYYDIFLTKGYDMENDLLELDDQDLDEMGITNKGHRSVIKNGAFTHSLTPEYKLYEWLKESGLDYYFINFVNSELINLEDIAKLHLPNEKLYDELEILLPGHQKRLRTAVRKLRKKSRVMSPEFETPVTEGWWGKPEFLQEAKYDFLCVDALLSSTKESAIGCERLQFMVDSGSDVVTVRQEVLDRLDLELIGPIQSRGVHASRTKNLYRAHLLIGNEELEIEVMGETYDSIGSRVIRHFRHYISGGRHVWLKGDYYDPSMSPKERVTSPRITENPSTSNQQHIEITQQHLNAKTNETSASVTVSLPTSEPKVKVESDTKDVSVNIKLKNKHVSDVDEEEISPSKRQRISEDAQEVNIEGSVNPQLMSQTSLDLSSSSLFTSLQSSCSSLHTSKSSNASHLYSQKDPERSHSALPCLSPVPTLISPLSSASEHSLPFPISEDHNSDNSGEIS